MLSERSCASSMISVSYCDSRGSACDSASRMPSVISLMAVPGRVWSVKRTLKPTTSPRVVCSSCAMRRAMLEAAIRRGCVWPMRRLDPRPSCRQIFGSCVVLPEPVSPLTMTTWCSAIARAMSSRRAETGSSSGKVMAGSGARTRGPAWRGGLGGVEPISVSPVDRVAKRSGRMQGGWRRTVAEPTAEPANAADARLSWQPSGAGLHWAHGVVAARVLARAMVPSPRLALHPNATSPRRPGILR